MLDPEFVKILVCPVNRTPVRVASEQEITDLNLDQMFDVFEAADKAIPSQETDDAKNTVLQTKTET